MLNKFRLSGAGTVLSNTVLQEGKWETSISKHNNNYKTIHKEVVLANRIFLKLNLHQNNNDNSAKLNVKVVVLLHGGLADGTAVLHTVAQTGSVATFCSGLTNARIPGTTVLVQELQG